MLKSEQNQSSAGPVNDKYVAMLEENKVLLEKNVAILEENKALLLAENERLKADIEELKSTQSVAVNQFNQPSQTQPFVQR
ncbi:hypothetical protein [Capnocytophaga sp.]|uniref:hypothetical protein n=1 Tax=Capnocytophaga sp. TaxID=44737 RepID=UPI0026DC8367|nr:hypothetical protein [Capnocytophaga sp.]MDO5106121.1 hypothetical protein [Capnocytophaga sp.]